ncbi:MAG: hypothetical protein WCV68_04115 [Candidatus Paceibacterota bacterium]
MRSLICKMSAGGDITLRGGGGSVGTLTPGNLTIDTGSNTITLGAALTVPGNLTITSGTLDTTASGCTGASCAVSVTGNWSNLGTFNGRAGTVTLNGGDQSISGNTTFYKLTKSSTTAATLTFAAGSTQIISNTLTLNGVASNLLSLRSSSPGSSWSINPQGTRVLSYLDVQDSNNTNATAIDVMTQNCMNSGRNTNWLFEITSNARGLLLNGRMNLTGGLHLR